MSDTETATLEPRVLVTGDQIAWVTKQAGRTCGLSAIHRVYDGRVTYCNHEIPDEDRRAGLAALLPALNTCKRCERTYGQALVAEREGRY